MTYVSIDLDSVDLWILRSLLASEYRPRVVSIEYNSNFPWGVPLAFPDVATTSMPEGAGTGWDRGCYFGSSAQAIDMVAREFGYVPVEVETALDLFFVPAELWHPRPSLSLATHVGVYRPFHVRLNHWFRNHTAIHRGWSAPQEAAYLDYGAYRRRVRGGGDETMSNTASSGTASSRRHGQYHLPMRNHSEAVEHARKAAEQLFARMRANGVPCFADSPCHPSALVACKAAVLCRSEATPDPCATLAHINH